MTHGQSVRYQMLVRVRAFGDQHRDLFPPDTVGGQAFDEIGAAVAQLSAQTASKMAAAREGISSKARARAALERQLDTITRSARVIARGNPGFDAPFHLPRPRTDHSLLIAGRMFVTEAEAGKARFVEYGMSPDFVTTLSNLVETFAQSLLSLESGRDGHTAARAGIDAALASALEAVRRLDVIVTNRLHDAPMPLAVWQRDRKVEYRRRLRRVSTVVKMKPEPVAAPAPTTQPAKVEAAVATGGATS